MSLLLCPGLGLQALATERASLHILISFVNLIRNRRTTINYSLQVKRSDRPLFKKTVFNSTLPQYIESNNSLMLIIFLEYI